MDFGFSEEQELLRAEVRKFLDQNASLEEVRKIVESEDGFARPLWERMAELGWVGLTGAEAHGGVGLDFVTLVVLLEETGRSLFPSPLISTVLAARAIEALGSEEQQKRWLPGLLDGTKIGTLAILEESDLLTPAGIAITGSPKDGGFELTGTKPFVPDGAQADLFVVAFRTGAGRGEDGISLAVLEAGAAGVLLTDYPRVDLTKRSAGLELSGAVVAEDALLGEPGSAWPQLRWLIDCGALLVAAEAVGAAEGAVEITTRFAKERKQFGSAIGRFQGVKHPLAEMHVDVESIKSLVYYAAWALDASPDEAQTAISRAKAYVAEVFPRLGIDAVGLHGGVGYTWEYDIQLYLKRAKWARAAYGDVEYHEARLAELAGF